jgi:50S ribosomal subunit-associated GTPase HflX
VHGILRDLGLDRIPVLNVLNKQDWVDAGTMEVLAAKTNGIAITATKAQTLHPLIEKMEQVIAGEAAGPDFSWPSDEAVMEINPLLTDTGRVL